MQLRFQELTCTSIHLLVLLNFNITPLHLYDRSIFPAIILRQIINNSRVLNPDHFPGSGLTLPGDDRVKNSNQLCIDFEARHATSILPFTYKLLDCIQHILKNSWLSNNIKKGKIFFTFFPPPPPLSLSLFLLSVLSIYFYYILILLLILNIIYLAHMTEFKRVGKIYWIQILRMGKIAEWNARSAIGRAFHLAASITVFYYFQARRGSSDWTRRTSNGRPRYSGGFRNSL